VVAAGVAVEAASVAVVAVVAVAAVGGHGTKCDVSKNNLSTTTLITRIFVS